MAGNFFNGQFFGGGFFGANVQPTTIDTHDGFDSGKKRDEEFSEKRQRLRNLLVLAIDPTAALPAEVIDMAAPVVERLESGAVRIDWERIEREATLAAKLDAYALELEKRRIEDEEDEEEVTILLWS